MSIPYHIITHQLQVLGESGLAVIVRIWDVTRLPALRHHGLKVNDKT